MRTTRLFLQHMPSESGYELGETVQLKASTDYGIRAVLYLAAQGTTCSSKDIAHDMSIPRDYLIQLAQLLRNAGLIEARPGKHGGYRLAKAPSDISMLQIISALSEDAKQSTRAKRVSRKNGAMIDGVKQTYRLIEESFDAYLGSLTIEMLLDCAQTPDRGSAYLAERLEEESRRLAACAASSSALSTSAETVGSRTASTLERSSGSEEVQPASSPICPALA